MSDTKQMRRTSYLSLYLLTLTISVIVNIETVYSQEEFNPLVVTPSSTIRGLRATDGDYSMFLGIPFATVNESNPFGAAIPNPTFDQIFDAFDDSAICPQIEEFNNTIVGTLDCLHINIYIPNSATSEDKLPVLVWIYGGLFEIGFSGRFLYGPKFLVRHDIILVTFNYRVGTYGFMSTHTPEIPGNAGLKDQVLALRWVYDNIEYFKGDSQKITVYGESAGSMALDIFMHSEVYIPFQSAILHSGSALYGAVREPDVTAPLKLASYLGLETDDIAEAVSFLAQIDPHLVIEATSNLNLLFRPNVEERFEGVEGIFYERLETLDTPRVRNISLMTGFNNHEQLSIWANLPPESYYDPFSDSMSQIFSAALKTGSKVESLLKYFYIGDNDIGIDLKWDLVDFSSDQRFVSKVLTSINKYMKNGAHNMFQLMFSYSGNRNFVKDRSGINKTVGGATHADEIGYLFDISYMQDRVISDEDQLIIDRLTTMWSNFVKYGHPVPEPNELLPVQFQRMTDDAFHYVEINLEMTTGQRPIHKRNAIWDLVYKINDKINQIN